MKSLMNESFEKMLAIGLSVIVVLAVLYGVGEAMVKSNSTSTSGQVTTSVGKLNATAPTALTTP